MIKHHPSEELLLAHAKGELPASMTIAVSAHCEMCPDCAERVRLFEAELSAIEFDSQEASLTDNSASKDYSDILTNILSGSAKPITKLSPSPAAHVDVGGERYPLPRSLRRYHHLGWSSIGAISRARLPLNEGDTRASLLHIGMNGGVPTHTHKGMEVTLLLCGHFEDEQGSYSPGDFILLDGKTNHSPHTHDGCLCYTIADAPLHFTKGVSQLLNTVGNLIY